MTRVDLGAVMRGGMPEPERICGGRLYLGQVHTLSGDMGAGKTTMAACWALEHMRAGGRAAYLDEESGHNQIARRMDAIGATPDEASQLEYHEFPGSDLAYWQTLARKMASAKADGVPSLVIVDSAAMALGNANLEENSSTDVAKLWSCFIAISRAPRQHAVVVIDQRSKNAEDSKYGRGSTQKGYNSDVVYKLTAVKPWNRDEDGVAVLSHDKDREGYLQRKARLEVRRGPLRFEPSEDTQQPQDDWKPTIIMTKISDALERESARPGAKPLSKSGIEKLKCGNAVRVREAIDELVSGGYLAESEGSRGPVYSFVKPFEANPVQPRLTPSVDGVATPSTPSALYKADGDGRGSEDLIDSTPSSENGRDPHGPASKQDSEASLAELRRVLEEGA